MKNVPLWADRLQSLPQLLALLSIKPVELCACYYPSSLILLWCVCSAVLIFAKKDASRFKVLMFPLAYLQIQILLRQALQYLTHSTEAPLLHINCYIHHSCKETSLPLPFSVINAPFKNACVTACMNVYLAVNGAREPKWQAKGGRNTDIAYDKAPCYHFCLYQLA